MLPYFLDLQPLVVSHPTHPTHPRSFFSLEPSPHPSHPCTTDNQSKGLLGRLTHSIQQRGAAQLTAAGVCAAAASKSTLQTVQQVALCSGLPDQETPVQCYNSIEKHASLGSGSGRLSGMHDQVVEVCRNAKVADAPETCLLEPSAKHMLDAAPEHVLVPVAIAVCAGDGRSLCMKTEVTACPAEPKDANYVPCLKKALLKCSGKSAAAQLTRSAAATSVAIGVVAWLAAQ